MRPRIWGPLVLALVVLAGADVVYGRVFQKVGGRGASLFRPEIVGRRLYATSMQVNGTPAEVTVAAAERGIAGIVRDVAAMGVPSRCVTGDGIAVGGLRDKGHTASVVAVAPEWDDRAVVIAVEQSDADRARARQPALAEGATLVPGMPGSVMTCTLRNDDTRTALECWRAAVAPSAALAYYDTTLRREGWLCIPPTGSQDSGLRLYAKGADICCLHVRMADPQGGCMVTIVRKPGGTN